MELITKAIGVLLLIVFSSLNSAYGQIVDMEEQIRAREHIESHTQDNDKDRHGNLFANYLTPRTGDPQAAFVDSVQLNAYHYSYVDGFSIAEAYMGTQAGPYLSLNYFQRPIDRWDPFFFTFPYRHLIQTGEKLRFFDTKVPYSYLSYLTSGSAEEQEQNFKALITTNLGPNFNIGGEVHIDNAGGHYAETASNNVTYRVFGSYTKRQYEAYLSVGNTNVVNQESGGITDMRYVTSPDDFQDGRRQLLPKDIPTKYKNTWNRVTFGEGKLHHRYRFGYYETLDKDGKVLKREVAKINLFSKLFKRKNREKVTSVADSLQNENSRDSTLFDKNNTPDSIHAPNQTPATLETDTLGAVPQKEIGEAPLDSLSKAQQISKPKRRVGQSIGQTLSPEEEREKDEPVKRFIPVAAVYHDLSYQKAARTFVSQDKQLLEEYPDPVLERVEGQIYYPYDYMSLTRISNALGVELIEGFKPWVKMGMSAFVAFDYEDYRQPLISEGDAKRLDLEYQELSSKEHTTFVGGKISSSSFDFLKYHIWGQVGVEGARAGEINVHGKAESDFQLWGKKVYLGADATFLNTIPSYFLRTYKSTLHEWNNDFKPSQTIRLGGELSLPFTHTRLHAHTEMIQNPLYSGRNGQPAQKEQNFRVIAVGLEQKLSWNILNLELAGLWQSSSDKEVAPLPMVSLYGNFYLKFKVAKVMDLQLGMDAKWHTKYQAPYYEPTTQLFIPQNEIELGGTAPLLTAYANAHLSRARFFVRYYNVGALFLRPNHFTMPYYPTYPPLLQVGVILDLKN